MTHFNLVDEPWIPCLAREGPLITELGLRDTLVRAHEFGAIADPSPLVVVSLHRLLLALLHRVYGPANSDAWRALRDGGRFPAEPLDAYLQRWRPRFDLFDSERPFYQTSELAAEYATGPIVRLAHEAGPNNAQMFSHTLEPAFAPAKAARALVAWMSFAAPGLVGFEQGDAANRSASGAPLATSAVTLVRGDTLFDTLLLNLVRYDRSDEEPFAVVGEDVPAWERDDQPRPVERVPTGYLDLLTWQSRRVRLLPEEDDAGMVVVRRTAHMKGYQIPQEFERKGRETMVAFRKNDKPKPGQAAWPPLSFRADRALWRDSLALFQSSKQATSRPKTLDWLATLKADGFLPRARIVPLDAMGVLWDQANVLFWRHERLPLPLAYLDDEELQSRLSTALELANDIAGALRRAMWVTARGALSPDSGGERREPATDDVRQLVDHLGAERVFWGRLEASFTRFLVEQAEDTVEDANSDSAYGLAPLMAWAGHLRRAALLSFREATDGFDRSSRGIEAVVDGESLLNREVGRLWKPWSLTEDRKEMTIAGS